MEEQWKGQCSVTAAQEPACPPARAAAALAARRLPPPAAAAAGSGLLGPGGEPGADDRPGVYEGPLRPDGEACI